MTLPARCQQPTTELTFAEELARILQRHGESSLMYVTAEFAPFSDQFKPDIIFHPKIGPNIEVTYFIELRLAREGRLKLDLAKMLPDHSIFVVEATGAPRLNYAFATDERVSTGLVNSLATKHIKVFPEVTNPQLLAGEILKWAKIF